MYARNHAPPPPRVLFTLRAAVTTSSLSSSSVSGFRKQNGEKRGTTTKRTLCGQKKKNCSGHIRTGVENNRSLSHSPRYNNNAGGRPAVFAIRRRRRRPHNIVRARTHTHTKRVLLHLYTIRNLLPVFLLFYIVCVCVCAYRLVIK